MKKTIFLFALALLALTNAVSAQKNSIKIAPFDIVTGRMTLTYERSIGTYTSAIVNLQARSSTYNNATGAVLVFGPIGALAPNTEIQKSGTSTELALRQYLSLKPGMRGLYIQPGYVFGKYEVTKTTSLGIFDIFSTRERTKEKSTEDINSLTLRIGYQMVTEGGFTMDMGLGVRKGAPLFNWRFGYAF